MTQAERMRKMQAVLDGEATPEETREIETLVGRDAEARAQFDELERLFAALRSLPQAHAPEGLVAAATRLYDQRNQLSTGDGVIEGNRIADPGGFPGRSVGRTPVDGEPRIYGGVTMSDRTGNRKLWIGAIALAVVAIAVSSQYIDFPTSGDATSGAITPAQRHRAVQPTASDIKLADPGTPTNVQGSMTAPAAAAASAAENAAQSNAQGVARAVAQDSAKATAQGMAHDSAKATAQGMAHDSAKATAQGMAHDSARATAQGMAHDSAKATAQGMAHDSAKATAQGMAKDSAKATAQGMAHDAAKATAQGVAK